MTEYNRFYCDCCGEISNTLETKYGLYCCNFCGHVLFETDEELDEYLHMPEPLPVIPFEKSKKMEK